MPEEGKNILEFKNYCRKNRVPFAIYADFESLNRDLRRLIEKYQYNVAYQEKISEQLVSTYGIYVHSDVPELFQSGYYNYRGPNAVNHFVRTILELEARMQSFLKYTYIPLDKTYDVERKF